MTANAPRFYTTREAASVVRFQPQSMHRALCTAGHFKGIVPTKLPGVSGRLLWPADQIDALARGEQIK